MWAESITVSLLADAREWSMNLAGKQHDNSQQPQTPKRSEFQNSTREKIG